MVELGDGGYAQRLAAGKERMVDVRAALRERSVRICGANNSRRSSSIDLPSALDNPERYAFTLTSLAATTLIFCAPYTNSVVVVVAWLELTGTRTCPRTCP